MIAQFTITFREAFEAILIVAIVIAYLKRTKRVFFVPYVLLGTFLAIVIGIITGSIIYIVYGILPEETQMLFEGLASIIAVCVLTSVMIWMARVGGELDMK